MKGEITHENRVEIRGLCTKRPRRRFLKKTSVTTTEVSGVIWREGGQRIDADVKKHTVIAYRYGARKLEEVPLGAEIEGVGRLQERQVPVYVDGKLLRNKQEQVVKVWKTEIVLTFFQVVQGPADEEIAADEADAPDEQPQGEAPSPEVSAPAVEEPAVADQVAADEVPQVDEPAIAEAEVEEEEEADASSDEAPQVSAEVPEVAGEEPAAPVVEPAASDEAEGDAQREPEAPEASEAPSSGEPETGESEGVEPPVADTADIGGGQGDGSGAEPESPGAQQPGAPGAEGADTGGSSEPEPESKFEDTEVLATPGARRRAIELDMDLRTVTGKGRRGKVRLMDVEEARKRRKAGLEDNEGKEVNPSGEAASEESDQGSGGDAESQGDGGEQAGEEAPAATAPESEEEAPTPQAETIIPEETPAASVEPTGLVEPPIERDAAPMPPAAEEPAPDVEEEEETPAAERSVPAEEPAAAPQAEPPAPTPLAETPGGHAPGVGIPGGERAQDAPVDPVEDGESLDGDDEFGTDLSELDFSSLEVEAGEEDEGGEQPV